MQYESIRGFRFSKVCLGTVALGMDYGISNTKGKPDISESREILDAAIRSGINSFDTAPGYGNAERLLGEVLKDQGKGINLITKCAVPTGNLKNRSLVRKQMFETVRNSMQLLGVSSIPICLFHKQIDQHAEEVLYCIPSVFEELKQEGLIKTAGISVNHSRETEAFAGLDIFEAIQTPVNVFDQAIETSGLIGQLQQQQKIVFARSIFLQGLFFVETDRLSGNLQQASMYLRKLQEIAREANRTVADLVFSYVLGIEGITSIVLGVTSLSELASGIGLLASQKIDQITKEKIRSAFLDMPAEIITPALWKTK